MMDSQDNILEQEVKEEVNQEVTAPEVETQEVAPAAEEVAPLLKKRLPSLKKRLPQGL